MSKCRFIPVATSHARAWQRGGGRLHVPRSGDCSSDFDGGIAGEAAASAHMSKSARFCCQDEDVLGLVVAGQGGGDLLRPRPCSAGRGVGRGRAGRVRRRPSARRIVKPGPADDVADDARQEKVHLDERLLHPLDIGAGGLDEDVAMAHQRAEGEDRPCGDGSCRARARHCGVRGATHSPRRRSCGRGRA